MSGAPWEYGDLVVRREVLKGHPWVGFPTYVVEDSEDLLAVYLAEGSTLAYADWPFDRWVHPWRTAGHTHWSGHGKLMLHRPGDRYSVDVFWSGPDRTFSGWYLNLQDPFRRWERGFDTLDHELDFWVPADGRWVVKDAEMFEHRVLEERYTDEEAAEVRATGREIVAMLESGAPWWDPAWATWAPPEQWVAAAVPPDWATAR